MRTHYSLIVLLCCTSFLLAGSNRTAAVDSDHGFAVDYAHLDFSLYCNDLVEVSLDEYCQAYIEPDDILEGGPYLNIDDFIVNVNNTNTNLVGFNDIGDTLTVSVTNPSNGNSCWGQIYVVDYLAPVIDCENITITCLQESGPEAIGYPEVSDNCDLVLDTSYVDEINPLIVNASTTVCVQIDNNTDDAEEHESGNVDLTSSDIELIFDTGNNFMQKVGLRFNGLNIPQGAVITSASIQFTAEATIGVDPCFLDIFGEDSDNAVTYANTSNNISNRPLTTESVHWTPADWISTGDAGAPQLTPDLSAIIQEIVDRGNYTSASSVAFIIEGIGKRTAFAHDSNPDYAAELCVTYLESCTDLNNDGICDVAPNDECSGIEITRTWIVSDQSGNADTCEQIITVLRPNLSELDWPANLDDIDEPALDCLDADQTHPDYTGWPSIDGIEIQNTCNFYATYTDSELPICDGSFKIVREWEFYDWCASETLYHTQYIKVLDKTPPMILCPDDIEIAVGQNSCYGALYVPQPTVYDDCSNQITIEVSANVGVFDGYILRDLPLGTMWVTYTATDACGNSSSCNFEIKVVDEIKPIPVCESLHTISLSSSEPTLIPAIVFDDGSYDNCSDLIYKARRKNSSGCPGDDATVFGDYVPFYCCDVGTLVDVILLVEDVAGNKLSCNVEVIVQDKLDPVIQCPPDLFLECYDNYNDLSITGEAIAYDNCSADVTYTQTENIDNCGGGLVQRTWTATDPGGRTASCVQKIYILNNAPFYISDTNCNNSNPNDGIIWPCDYETPDCDAIADPSIAGKPTITEDGCDLVAYTYQDLVFPITPPACIKILRKWTVIDWCQYDQATGYGRWEYTQVIKILNVTAPDIISDCEDKFFCSFQENCGPAPATLSVNATDDCTPAVDINYHYKIDLNNNGTVDLQGDGKEVSDDFALGTHSIKWFAEDGCGNVTTCEYLFVMEDCKKPTPYCLNGISTELMANTGMVTVWASDLDLGSYDNCGVAELRIASPSLGPGQSTPPAPGSHSVTFDCWNEGTNSVDLWVGDVNGNWAYCTTYVIIQDNHQICNNGTASSQITGSISTVNGDFVENVTVSIDGNMSGLPNPEVTGAEGIYAFPWLAVGQDYTIVPEKDMNPLNGVTTFDLVLITKHILQSQMLTSPYQLIAGDINHSGSLSAFDIVMLRRLILTIDDTFTSNTSWRFIQADFVFPNPANPWATPFPEIFEIGNLGGSQTADFVAVKIGDVNATAIPNNLADESDDRNSGEPLYFEVKDKKLEAGKTYSVDFSLDDFSKIQGFQFTLAYDKDKIAVEYIEPGKLSNINSDNFGLHRLDEGVITASWNLSQIEESNSNELGGVAFSLILSAGQDVNLSDVFEINSSYTRAEAYISNSLEATGEIEIIDVNLNFINSNIDAQANEFKLYPNQPNPFIKETLIRFDLPEATSLTLTIQDVSGKTLKVIKGDFEAGYNEISIQKGDLNGNGIFFYTLQTQTNQASGKMVLIQR